MTGKAYSFKEATQKYGLLKDVKVLNQKRKVVGKGSGICSSRLLSGKKPHKGCI